MKRVLVAIDSLQIGGITSSYKSILMQIAKIPSFEVHPIVLNNQNLNNPNYVQVKASKVISVFYINKNEVKIMKTGIKILYFITRLFKYVLGELNTKRIFFSFVKKQRYDVVISFSNDIYKNSRKTYLTNIYVSKCTQSYTKIAWIHADPFDIGINSKIAKKIYKNFNKIVCVSNEHKYRIDYFCKSIRHKTIPIKNFIDYQSIVSKSNEFEVPFSKEVINILTVGRVEFETKGIDRIVDISIMLIENGIRNFVWNVIGTGKNYGDMLSLIQVKSLTEHVILKGELSNPYPYMKHSDILVLPSRFEAFPVVVLEAHCLYLPVIVTKYPSAIEQIRERENGLIAENNIDDLFQKILFFIKDNNYKHVKRSMQNHSYEDDAQSLTNLYAILGVDNNA